MSMSIVLWAITQRTSIIIGIIDVLISISMSCFANDGEGEWGGAGSWLLQLHPPTPSACALLFLHLEGVLLH